MPDEVDFSKLKPLNRVFILIPDGVKIDTGRGPGNSIWLETTGEVEVFIRGNVKVKEVKS